MVFYNKTFYGNTVYQWFISLIIILGVVLLTKVLYWIMSNVIKKAARKTKTNIDDLLIEMLEGPLIFVVSLIVVWFAIKRLVLPELATRWMGNIYQLLVVLSIACF